MRTQGLLAALGVLTLAACSDNQGKSGAVTLVSVSDAFASEECPSGGKRVDAGRDTNRNAQLDAKEITSTGYICDGAIGVDGAEVARGDDGQPGANGGLTAVRVGPEPAGAACEAGGQRIDIGPDADSDGKIDAGAAVRTTYVCDGVSGSDGEAGVTALVSTSAEAAGANCAGGGKRLDYGADTDRDGVLDASEILGTRYVCDGTNGANGTAPLVDVTAEPAGANCAAGGKRVDHGQDADADGVLEPSEVAGTKYICDGSSGADAKRGLVDVVAEPPGASCATGGQKVTFGSDDDGDGSLAPGEIDGTRYVCNAQGADADGKLALVAVVAEAPGGNCTGGGKKVSLGLDDDGDKILDPGEVDSVSYVCDFDSFVNGSFELPDYAGWTVGSTSSGQWMLVTNGTTLTSGQTWFDYADKRNETINSIGLPLTVVATNGTTVAVQLQNSPGVHRIYQDFTVPLSATTLAWDMYYKNTNASFDATRQYIAINVRRAVDDSVVATLYKTLPGAPLALAGMQPFSADLSAFAGQDIRFDIETNIQLSWIDVVLDNFRIQ